MHESLVEEAIDVLIIGAGPAGLSAAVNAKARNLTAAVVDSREPVQHVRTYPEVTNYLGFTRSTGAELANHFAQHFCKTGYQFVKDRALKVIPMDDTFVTSTERANYRSLAVILTTGVSRSKTLPGEEQFLGHGVSYCVTCDGALYRGKDVVVVGYMHEGEEEANALAGLARSVTYVPVYERAETLAHQVEVVHAKPAAVIGDHHAQALRTDAGDLRADGIFIIRQGVPMATLVDDLEFSGNFVCVNREMATNIPGLYAAGDCAGPPFQIAKAVGEGQVAALNAAKYVYGKKKEMVRHGDADRR
jgi:thioredoxin reductase (NADPH)